MTFVGRYRYELAGTIAWLIAGWGLHLIGVKF
jgi:hypothetical protein